LLVLTTADFISLEYKYSAEISGTWATNRIPA